MCRESGMGEPYQSLHGRAVMKLPIERDPPTWPKIADYSTEELLHLYRRFSDNDGTMTMEEEIRLYLLQEIGAELQRRGVSLERTVTRKET